MDQAGLGPKEALLVGVEDRYQGDLRQVEPLPKQVDANQHVVFAETKVAKYLHPLERVDLAVQIARP